MTAKKLKIGPLIRNMALSGLLLATPLTHAKDEGGLLGPDFNVTYDGEIISGYSSNREGEDRFDPRGSFVSLSVQWKRKVRAVLTGKIEEIFREKRPQIDEDFDIAEFVQEAYIEIREISGTPVAVVIGKQPIPFGQNVQAMPLFKNNPLSEAQEIDEVFGITVNLTEGLFGFFDQAEIAAFEAGSGDLKIAGERGYSIRLSKLFSENWLFTLSHAQREIKGQEDKEKRTSLGLIGETPDGVLVGWAEGILLSDSPEYANAEYGATIGGMMRVHKATDVIVEYTHIENEIKEIALGLRSAFTEHLSGGVEVRYSENENGGDELRGGVTLTYTFGNTPYSLNNEYLIESDEKNKSMLYE